MRRFITLLLSITMVISCTVICPAFAESTEQPSNTGILYRYREKVEKTSNIPLETPWTLISQTSSMQLLYEYDGLTSGQISSYENKYSSDYYFLKSSHSGSAVKYTTSPNNKGTAYYFDKALPDCGMYDESQYTYSYHPTTGIKLYYSDVVNTYTLCVYAKYEYKYWKWSEWSEWSETTYVSNESMQVETIETNVLYRYREKKYITSKTTLDEPWVLYNTTTEYEHSDFLTTVLDISETISSSYCIHKKESVNRYVKPGGGSWFYATPSEYIDHIINNSSLTSYNPDGKTYYRYTYCTKKTQYELKHYYMWTDWSEWSYTPKTENEDCEVETKIDTIYCITYDANGGEGAPPSVTKYFDEIITLSSNIPTRENHQFLGWSTSAQGEVEYAPGAEYSANKDVTLYAVWINATEYTVTYDANGGTGAPQSQIKVHGEDLTLSSVTPSRDNYEFVGWSTSKNGKAEYSAQQIYTSNSSVVLYAVWQKLITEDVFSWTFTDGVLTISGSGRMPDWEEDMVPWYNNRYKIKQVTVSDGFTSIGNYAFYDCTLMTSISLPSSITQIGNNAFVCCNSIERFVFPTDVVSIGEKAFGWCSSLKEVVLNDGICNIGDYAFNGCRELESINLPGSLETIGDFAFQSCESLTDIQMENNITAIGNAAFAECHSLRNVKLSDSLVEIPEFAFGYCDSLASIVIPKNVTDIKAHAFYYCTNLGTITFNENLKRIKSYAFAICSSLESVSLPCKLESIYDNAFCDCDILHTVSFPKSLIEICSGAFSYCNNLKDVFYGSSEDDWKKVSILTNNDPIFDANIHYTETETYVISFNANGGTGAPNSQLKDYNTDLVLSTVIPTRIGYKFMGWAINATGTVEYMPGDVYDKNESATLYAIWSVCSHNWGESAITTQPTHTSYGECTFTCNDCSATKTEQIAKTTEHSYGKWTKMDDESHKRSCACGNIETSTHNWNSGVITAQPTHTTFGERTFTCNDCSATKTEQIAKTTEHSYGKWTKKDDEFHKRSCACGNIETSTHNWDNGVITIQPTHTTFGERTFTCNDCSATKTEQIAKTTEHSFGKWTNVDTSNHSRSCECGDLETSTHNWDNGVITIQPTHTTFGERTFTCNDCSATKTEQIPTLSNIKDSGICGDSLTWVLDNEGTLTISGTGDMYDFQPPEALRGSEEGLLILPWESYLGLIKNVIIEDGVTNIGESAFCGCDNLVSVVVSGSVTSIGNFAFYSCTNLATIEIPYNVTSIGDLAFYSCAGLTAVEIPDSVTSIGECAFDSCTNLATIEIPNSVTSIGNMAFSSCTNLTSVVIGTGVTSIATCAFESCTALTSIIIPDNVTNIGDNAFYNCTNLTICGYEGSYTQTYAQENSIPFTVIIKHGKCGENLTWTLDIECTLTVSGEGDMTSYSSPPWYSYSQAIKKIVIKNGVTSIDDYAFSYCTYLTSVDIPDSITSIGNYAFEDCNNLTSIIVPDSVKTIGCGAFHLCTSLEEITIPFIGFSRDSECEYGVFGYIFSYHDEDSDGSLGVGSFCCGAGIEQYREYKQDFYIRYCYHIPKSLKKVTFTGEKIPAGAFKNCYIIDEIELSKSLINIGDEAFYRCSGLTDVYIPESVTSIGDKAFYNCANLTICCSEGSYAQTYAQENSIPYTIWKSQIEFIGAQIRTDDPQGLRFVFSIPREKYEALSHPQSTNDTGVGFGSVVMPKKYLGDNELTKDTVVTIDGKEYKSKISPAVNLYEITDDEIKYTVCIIGISPTNYTSEYVAVPYMTYIDDTGEEITIYGECTENITVYSIAELAYQDSSSSEGVKKYLYNNILSIVDPEKYPTNK